MKVSFLYLHSERQRVNALNNTAQHLFDVLFISSKAM
jgi:hypothetical protein